MASQNQDTQLTWGQYGQQITSQAMQWVTATFNDPKYGMKAPEGYNAGNEIEAAMFKIINDVKDKNGTPALQCCTKESIFSALRSMASMGLSVQKNQVYLIVRGEKLTLMTSYLGDMAVLDQVMPWAKVSANVLYEGDEYEYCYDEEGGFNYISNVRSKLENRDKPIIAAFGQIVDARTGKRIYGEVMTKSEIQAAWNKSSDKSQHTHKEFPQEMAKKTLIHRLCKKFINTQHGTDMRVAAYNEAISAEYENAPLENITPPESEVEKQKMIRGKSKGVAGLKAILDSDSPGRDSRPSEEPSKEIIPPTPKEEPQQLPREESDEGTNGELDLEGGMNGASDFDRIPF